MTTAFKCGPYKEVIIVTTKVFATMQGVTKISVPTRYT